MHQSVFQISLSFLACLACAPTPNTRQVRQSYCILSFLKYTNWSKNWCILSDCIYYTVLSSFSIVRARRCPVQLHFSVPRGNFKVTGAAVLAAIVSVSTARRGRGVIGHVWAWCTIAIVNTIYAKPSRRSRERRASRGQAIKMQNIGVGRPSPSTPSFTSCWSPQGVHLACMCAYVHIMCTYMYVVACAIMHEQQQT